MIEKVNVIGVTMIYLLYYLIQGRKQNSDLSPS